MAAPLADVAELNDPHVAALFPGVQLQLTPELVESLATVAVIESVSLTYKDRGVELSDTVMGGGGGVLLELPHATRAAITPRAIARRIDLGRVVLWSAIARLRSSQLGVPFSVVACAARSPRA